VLFLLALPLLIYLSFKQKYRYSIPARFFLFKNPRFSAKEQLWFHVCSFGESVALKPLLEHLKDEKIVISTITQTGYNQAQKYDAEVRYLPYEMWLPFWIKKQKVLVVLEAEFWYMLFSVAFAQGSTIILLNARIADNSVHKYMKFRWFYKKILAKVAIVLAQGEKDKERFLALGAKNVEVVGNIKLAAKITHTQEYHKPEMQVIVAGSTHPDEEEMILQAFVKYEQDNEDEAKLIIVPRHPERFEEVYQLMQRYSQKYGWSLSRFSKDKSLKTKMVLVDMMGELNNIYKISDIAILGGAFRNDVGGHNPLEPATFGCKIITGKYYFHQKELFKYLKNGQYVDSDADAITLALKNAKKLPPSRVDERVDLEKIVDIIKEKMEY